MNLKGTLTLVLLMASALAGCGKSTAEAFCAKQAECGAIPKSQEEQCVADANKSNEALAKDEGCKKTKEAGDALQACLSGLSCEEMKTSNAMNQKCAQELAEVAVAAFSELSTCKASIPNQTSSSSSSGAGGGGGAGGADGSSSSSSAGGGGGAGGAGSSSSSSGI